MDHPHADMTPRLPPSRAHGRIYGSIQETVGGTPLVRVPRLAAAEGVVADLAVKLEFFNPLGSVKDRIGLAMIAAAEAAGLIAPDRSVLVEPTSGNTGIALAFVAAARGYKLVVTMPEGASIERRKMLKLMGAEVRLTPARQGMAGAISEAESIIAATPGAWMPRQFDNPANPAIHEATTAEEIWTDTAGLVDIVVAGAGTGGTLTGIARALKPRRPGLRMFVVEPAESAVLSGDEPGPHGLQGIGPGFHPAQPRSFAHGRHNPRQRTGGYFRRPGVCAERRPADRDFVRRRASRGDRTGAGSGQRGQADRLHRPQLRRTLFVHRPVRRAVTSIHRRPAGALARR